MTSSGKKIKLSLVGNKKESVCFTHNDYYSDEKSFRKVSEKALEKLKHARYETLFVFYCFVTWYST